MRVSIDTKDINKALKEIERFTEEKQQAVKDVINESALNIQRGAKQRCRVDTGRLRSSIAIEPYKNGYSAQVGTKVKYAPYVEFGTGKHVDIPAAANFSATGRQTPWMYPLSKGGLSTGEMVWTSGNKPRPFLFPAAEDERPRFISAMRGALGK